MRRTEMEISLIANGRGVRGRGGMEVEKEAEKEEALEEMLGVQPWRWRRRSGGSIYPAEAHGVASCVEVGPYALLRCSMLRLVWSWRRRVMSC